MPRQGFHIMSMAIVLRRPYSSNRFFPGLLDCRIMSTNHAFHTVTFLSNDIGRRRRSRRDECYRDEQADEESQCFNADRGQSLTRVKGHKQPLSHRSRSLIQNGAHDRVREGFHPAIAWMGRDSIMGEGSFRTCRVVRIASDEAGIDEANVGFLRSLLQHPVFGSVGPERTANHDQGMTFGQGTSQDAHHPGFEFRLGVFGT